MEKRAKKTDTRIKLIETGLTLFAKNGYNGTGIKEIVDGADVPKGSFYNYFRSKEAFTVEIIRHYSQALSNMWDASLASGPSDDPHGALRNSFEMIVGLQEGAGVKSGCLIGNLAAEISEASDLCRQEMHRSTTAWKDRVSFYIEQGQAGGSIRNDISSRTLTEFIWNAWEGALLNMKIANSTDPIKECICVLFDFFLKPQKN
ncbi:transcriptional regulator (TetR-family protein) [Desulforapulum autotrophicum HRM2]|uniref:Transcriptional regulator (TetR-family protein) n=1 Tax=Desulforapulum autotrophicum (strain ATCC 43914 / DSM 3382 / VKM B-1955 / HRM2) TaxID=177437 RepID=C0QL39_DESAH|nr:TetR/AcrR family transcriptional regulator [Desulforapulum autotrophicum]ACN14125.1 transcriptional regulator (TetR-family protein) [Desulforapulum autotrophicum HRM2]